MIIRPKLIITIADDHKDNNKIDITEDANKSYDIN